ncbi:MAG TPA: hypothetical protein VK985_09610 [Rariglobus sp.]|nr:hypothetical protein [Rariglobus sp.]
MASYRINGTLAAELGATNLQRNRVSQGMGTASFVLDGMLWDGTLPDGMNDDDTVIITKDGATWFYGRVTDVTRAATGTGEAVTITLSDPWWYLSNLVYQQQWKTGETGALRDRSTVILNANAAGDRVSIRDMIASVFAYCIAAGGPVAVDVSSLPELLLPLDEMRDPTCAEVILKQLRFIPDTVTRWDLSGEVPVLKFQRRAGAPAVTINAATIQHLTAASLKALTQQVSPAVVFKYEITTTVNDGVYTDVVVRKFPVDAVENQFRVPVATFRLAGDSITIETQRVECTDIMPGELSWWKKKLTWLDAAQNSQITGDVTISGGEILNPDALEDAAEFARELTADSLAPHWKETDFREVPVKALATYTLIEATTGSKITKVNEPIVTNVRATRLHSKTYQNRIVNAIGEEVPTGLEEAFYGSVSVLHYEGTLTITGAEPRDDLWPGKVLNISNAFAAWVAMNAQVQQVTDIVDSGTTTVRVGRPNNLGPSDLLELLRINRGRSGSQAVTTLTTGRPSQAQVKGAAGGAVQNASTAGGALGELDMKVAATETVAASQARMVPGYFVVAAPTADGAPSESSRVVMDLGAAQGGLIEWFLGLFGKSISLEGAALKHDMSIREVDWCEPGSTTPKKVLVLMSEPYTPPAP